MPDAGNKLADLLGEEAVERLRQSPLWRAMRELREEWDAAPSSGDIERAQEELLSYIRSMVEEIKHDAKVFPQLSNIISNAARMARASYHWERHIGRTRHSAQLRRLVTLSDSLSQAAALLDGVDLDETQLVSAADEESRSVSDVDVTGLTNTRVELVQLPEQLAHVHRMLSELQQKLNAGSSTGAGPVTVDLGVINVQIDDIKRYIRGENNG